MRKQFVKTVSEMLKNDSRTVLLLGDIGVFSFREEFAKYPNRVYNIGILEQATVSMAAGLAMTGHVPIVHTIAPFLVERAYEQLKIDFGYQQLPGLFVSVGASYDYASLGCTHHCPADVSLIENIPGFEIEVPGNQPELAAALTRELKGPRYVRMTENSYKFQPEKLKLKTDGAEACILGVGPAMDIVLEATEHLPVYHLYTPHVIPFKFELLYGPLKAGIRKFIVVEPYFSSHLADKIRAFAGASDCASHVCNFSIPRRFFRSYGKCEQHNEAAEFTAPKLKEFIESCLAFQASSSTTPSRP